MATLDAPTIQALLPMLGSLQGTLTPEGTVTALQAQQQADQQATADQAAQAAQGAQQASDQFQQATQAPIPDAAAGNSIQTLFGNVASVLAQNPEYSRRAHANLAAKQNDLMEARRTNLTALHELYQQKAQAAEKLGNMAEAEKARMSQEKMAVALQKLKDQGQIEQDKQKQDADRKAAEQLAKDQLNKELQGIHAKGVEDRLTLAQKQALDKAVAQGDVNTYLPTLVKTLQSQNPRTGAANSVLMISDVPLKDRGKALQYAAENKIPAISKEGQDKLEKIDSSRKNIQAMLEGGKEILPGSPLARFAQYPTRTFSDLMQTNASRTAWKAWRIAAIKTLTALAGGLGSGMRINQAEIMTSIKNDIPTINDTWETAQTKLARVSKMLDNTEAPIIYNDWRTFGSKNGLPAPVGIEPPVNRDPKGLR